MLYFSASVLNTAPSTSRISRRITLSRVVVLPMNVMRLTKYCWPSCSRIVTSTVGGPAGWRRGQRRPGTVVLRLVAQLELGKPGELHVAAGAVDLPRLDRGRRESPSRCTSRRFRP